MFWRIFTESDWNYAFGSKNWLSQKEAKNYSERFFFSRSLKCGKSRNFFWFDWNNFFCQTSEKGQLLTKTFFLHQMSHIQLNQAFQLFWSIFAEIDWKHHFWVKKVIISERSYYYSESCFSQPVWTGTNTEDRFDLMETPFEVIWSIFAEIEWKILFRVEKLTISERN